MMVSLDVPVTATPLQTAANFRAWQRDTIDRGLLPVIGVTGGRGKSTVLRMLDAILNQAHLRTATWSNLGIDIRGRRQRGEISGWSLALSRLAEASIDIAIQELHWSTINAVGLPTSSYPVVAVTNLTGSAETPHGDADRTVRRAANRVASAVHGEGMLIVNGDDPGLIESTSGAACAMALTSLSHESPALRRHFERGGSGVWIERDEVRSGAFERSRSLCAEFDIAANLSGAASFQTANALTAIAIASGIGVDDETIVRAIHRFESSPDILPGSFNVQEVGSYRVVVDFAAPSWHLRGVLRAANHGNRRRQITVLGCLERQPEDDLHEVGRLLGRYQGAIIIHSTDRQDLIDRFKRGIAVNDYPPVVVHLPTERRALNKALKTARSNDVVLVLASADPGPALRSIGRLAANEPPE